MNSKSNYLGQTLNNYTILEEISMGSFGTVYSAIEKNTSQKLAIKIEEISEDKNTIKTTLFDEASFLYELKHEPLFPKIHYYSRQKTFNYLVMDLFGQNLEELLKNTTNGVFPLQTVLILAEQMLIRLQKIHEKGIIHRDLKPENFVIGLEKMNNSIYLIDYGLSKKFKDKLGNHIVFNPKKGFVGTVRYTSASAQLGNEQSRRDDLESFIYILIYFLKGELPWMNLKFEDRDIKFKQILEMKINLKSSKICENLPIEIKQALDYVKTLGFYDEPNYELLKKLFKTAKSRIFGTKHNILEWNEPKYLGETIVKKKSFFQTFSNLFSKSKKSLISKESPLIQEIANKTLTNLIGNSNILKTNFSIDNTNNKENKNGNIKTCEDILIQTNSGTINKKNINQDKISYNCNDFEEYPIKQEAKQIHKIIKKYSSENQS